MCVTLFCLNAHGAAGKFIEVLLKGGGDLISTMGKKGIKGAPAQKVERYIAHALLSLNAGEVLSSPTALKKVINSLPVGSNADEIAMVKQIKKVFAKSSNSLDHGEMVEAINNLIFLANRYGTKGSAILACAECVSDALIAHGFKFTLEVIENSAAKRLLENAIPRDTAGIKTYITDIITKSNKGKGAKYFDNFTRMSHDLVAPEEERALALFFGLRGEGSKKQKQLIELIERVSKNERGNIHLLNPDNPHKLWKLFSEDMSDEVMDGWIELLENVSKNSDGDISKKNAFYKYLKKRAGNDPVLNEHLNLLKRKKCFFN